MSDNPLLFGEERPSGGNFHAQPSPSPSTSWRSRLLAAAQGIAFHAPLSTSPALARANEAISARVPFAKADRAWGDDMEWAKAAVLDGALSGAVQAELFGQ